MRVSLRLRHGQLTCYSLLIKSSAYITEHSRVWIRLRILGYHKATPRTLLIFKVRGLFLWLWVAESFSLGVASTGTRVNNVNKSWWPGFVGTHSHTLQQGYMQSETQSSMEMRDSFKTLVSARSTKIQRPSLLSPWQYATCISSVWKSKALIIWTNRFSYSFLLLFPLEKSEKQQTVDNGLI